MASKRKSTTNSTSFNFRPQTESQKWETKGTKPLPNPVSVKGALLTMVIHVCRKILFVNTKLKVGLYLAGLFLSFVCDVAPFPKTYFSRSNNIFNQNFVKFGWAWTLVLTVPFVFLTSFTYCCGKRKMILIHLSRLGVATLVWFVFTKSFALIEQNFGKCSVKSEKYPTKQACIAKGFFWHSLDISGHAFILIWSSLVIIEEARAIIGWETIQDLIRNEEHSRTSETDLSSPLRQLPDEDLYIMKMSYTKFTPYVRGLFIAMTLLSILWDVMVVSTILYFHIMIEKLISGILAIGVWFITYNYWYTLPGVMPTLPGEGLFRYNKIREVRQQKDGPIRGRGPINVPNSSKSGQLPTFMGMPLYGLRSQESKEDATKLSNTTMKEDSVSSESDIFNSKTSLNSSSTRTNSSSLTSLKFGTPPKVSSKASLRNVL